MTTSDIIGLVLSYVYAFGLLITVEAIGKALKWKPNFTRKIIHIGAGMWVWALLTFMDHWYFGIIPFATFILLNYVFYRQQTFKQMDDEDATPGTVYFAMAITILFGLLWRTGEGVIDRAPIATAAVMAMTWGDAMGSIVGRKWGVHRYQTFGHTRSWEGSAAVFVLSFIAMWITLAALPGSQLSPNSDKIGMGVAAIMALIGAIVATAAEAFSPGGTDNLSMPLLTGAVLYGLSMIV
jgi:phytol kinase